MRRNQNQTSQPLSTHAIFQNWDIVANSWYYVAPSSQIKKKAIFPLNIHNQYLVIYRGEDGKIRAMDGFCPHMGSDFRIGKVIGNRIRCFFHHWEFSESGKCEKIPCLENKTSLNIPEEKKGPNYKTDEKKQGIKIAFYAVEEKFGSVWVFPDKEASFSLPTFSDHENMQTFKVVFGKSFERSCHHHVTMINGIDPQHLRTVHNFDVSMDISMQEKHQHILDIALKGNLPDKTWWQKILFKVLGGQYGYEMRYSGGSIGFLTMAQKIKIFGRWSFPPLYMIFAYRPIAFGRTFVQPLFLTPKENKPLKRKYLGSSYWKEKLLIFMTKRMFYALQSEDGKIYDNMRFNSGQLIEQDRPIAVFIRFINRLNPSKWSNENPK